MQGVAHAFILSGGAIGLAMGTTLLERFGDRASSAVVRSLSQRIDELDVRPLPGKTDTS